MTAQVDESTRLLRIVVRLLSLQLVAGEAPRPDRIRTQLDKIRLLSSVGMGPGEIADVLGTTSNTVSVALVKLRKQGGAKASGKKKAKKSNDTAPLLGFDEPTDDNNQ